MHFAKFTIICLLSAAQGCAGEAGTSANGGGNVGFGGAQDIGQFRGLLEAGAIPGPATLDANGFFSEHRTELPPPDCGALLCAHAMVSHGSAWLDNSPQTSLQVSLNTPVDPRTFERKPLNMVVVVDTSGSMQIDSRLEFVKQGLHLLVDDLEDGDRLGVVTYSSRGYLRESLETAPNKEALHALIDTMVANGGTNIYEGLDLGLSEAQTYFDLERQNRVILLSDGMATEGITSDGEILELASSYISEGIGLTTIGVGQSFNVELMRGLSERGAGNFYFVEDSSAVTEVFTEELDYFVTPLALSVSIEVSAGAGFSVGDVTGTKLWKTSGNGGEVFLPAVFVASRVDDETPNGRRGGGSALIIDIERTNLETDGPLGAVTLSYRDPAAADPNAVITQTFEVGSPPRTTGEPGPDPFVSRAAMAEHYAVYNMFLGLRYASEQADGGQYNCAYAALSTVRQRGAWWNENREDTDIASDLGLIDMFQGNLATAGVNGADADGACQRGDDGPWQGDDYAGDHGHHHPCSLAAGGGAPSGMAVLLIGLILGGRVRRKRRS